jgi:hypothetical protein
MFVRGRWQKTVELSQPHAIPEAKNRQLPMLIKHDGRPSVGVDKNPSLH